MGRNDDTRRTSSPARKAEKLPGETTRERLRRLFPGIQIVDEPEAVIITGVGPHPASPEREVSAGEQGPPKSPPAGTPTTSPAPSGTAERPGENTNERLKRMVPTIQIDPTPSSAILPGIGAPSTERAERSNAGAPLRGIRDRRKN